MFFILVKNYIKSLLDLIGSSKKIKRIKGTFELHGFQIYLDAYCSIERKKAYNLIEYYNNLFIRQDINWKLDRYLDVMCRSKENGDMEGYNSIKGFIELVILSEIGGTHTYINYIIVKSISDIRNDKLNKLLTTK